MMTARHAHGSLEFEDLLEELFQRHHCDFRGYSRASLSRCVARAQEALGSPTVEHLRARVRDDGNALRLLLGSMTTQVSDLFRDPPYFRALREQVVPHLATYPSIRVWVAGCGSGEEAYSIAIVLHEAGLLDRSLVYGTDIDEDSLRRASEGCYPIDRVAGFADNYRSAGGSARLSDYYQSSRTTLTFHAALREHVHFSEHSLATDTVFAEVQLVSCRNVLIYFGHALRDRALEVFEASLCSRGFLGLGARETLQSPSHAPRYQAFAEAARIYRRS